MKARTETSTRENSLVTTKLQEALMWQNEHQKTCIDLARKAGVGMTTNGQSYVPIDDKGNPVA
jgi:hypothetical protein